MAMPSLSDADSSAAPVWVTLPEAPDKLTPAPAKASREILPMGGGSSECAAEPSSALPTMVTRSQRRRSLRRRRLVVVEVDVRVERVTDLELEVRGSRVTVVLLVHDVRRPAQHERIGGHVAILVGQHPLVAGRHVHPDVRTAVRTLEAVVAVRLVELRR